MAHVSPISLHLHPLPKADITNWSLPSFTLSQDWSAESFSSQHSRKSLLRNQSWHTRWNLFIILFKILEHGSGTGSLIWSSHENYAFYLLRAYLFFVVIYLLSCVQLFAALWTVDHKASLSMGFPRQEYWRVCCFLLKGISPTQGSNLCLLHWQADSLPMSHHQLSPCMSVLSKSYFFKIQFLKLWILCILF